MVDNECNKIFGIKQCIDPDLLKLRYSESAKVIDYTKSQQWQVTSVSIGLHFGILTFFKALEDPIVSSIILIVVFAVTVIGIVLNVLLFISAKKHREIIDVLDHNCFINGLIEREIKDIKAKYEYVRIFSNSFFSCLYIVVIIFSLILSLCILKERSVLIDNLFKSVIQFFSFQ